MARSFYDTYGRPESTEMRIGDPERDVTRDHLAWAYSAGYLLREEFDDRSGMVNEARTQTALNRVVRDLPKKPEVAKGEVVKTKKKGNPLVRTYMGLHPSFRAIAFLPVSGIVGVAVPISLLANHPNPSPISMFIGVAAVVIGSTSGIIEVIVAVACSD